MSPAVAPATRDRLRIAIQKSGRLAEPARALLSACGLSWRESRDKLFCYGESLPVDLLLVRDDDIPGLIADGVCDFGVVGRNELNEQAAARADFGLSDAYAEVRALGFGNCRLMLAVPDDWEWTGAAQLQGMRIATSYPAILADLEAFQRDLVEARRDFAQGHVAPPAHVFEQCSHRVACFYGDLLHRTQQRGTTRLGIQQRPVQPVHASDLSTDRTIRPCAPARSSSSSRCQVTRPWHMVCSDSGPPFSAAR